MSLQIHCKVPPEINRTMSLVLIQERVISSLIGEGIGATALCPANIRFRPGLNSARFESFIPVYGN
jgi:hypothetical protein